MANLLKFLKDTSGNAESLKAFQKDPDAAMKAANLTDEEIKAVKSGDRAQIASLVEPGAEGAFLTVTVGLLIQIS